VQVQADQARLVGGVSTKDRAGLANEGFARPLIAVE
jgi:hypothetical protein